MKQANILKKTTAAFNASKSKVAAPEVKTSFSNVETPQVKKAHLKTECSTQKIQEKAYELFLKRNGGPGSAEQDWAEAERIVKGL